MLRKMALSLAVLILPVFAQDKEAVAKPQFVSKAALAWLDSEFSQSAYGRSDMSLCENCEPASQSSHLDREVGSATTSKIYVQLEDLVFASDGIWFKNSPDRVQVGTEALHVDSGGYYVAKEEQNWICPKCTYLNKRPYPRYPCLNCGWPYD